MITSRFFDFERRENGFYVGNFTIILPSFYHCQIPDIKKPTVTGWFLYK
jgi:hypothetical protein